MPKIFSCLKKRNLLHDPQVGGNQLILVGQEYFQQGRLADALDFFEKAKNPEGIRKVMGRSIEEGDPFLLQQTGRLLGETVAEEIWRKVGENALADGRFLQALTAFKTIPDEKKIEEIQARLGSYGQHAQ
jgi:hypothetical protein